MSPTISGLLDVPAHAELTPSYEELQARIAELQAEREDARSRLQRLAEVQNPRDKILLGLGEQIRTLGMADMCARYLVVDGRLELWAPEIKRISVEEENWRQASRLQRPIYRSYGSPRSQESVTVLRMLPV